MKALLCEMCGSHDIIKKDGYYVCQACEIKYTVEEARKMLASDTVKIDNSAKLENYYKIARQARDTNDSENAAKYYDLIMQEDPSSWEATFYNVYYRAMQTKIAYIASAANSIRNCLCNIFTLIKDHVDSDNERYVVIAEIALRITYICTLLESNARTTLKSGIDRTTSGKLWLDYSVEYGNRVAAIYSLLFAFGDLVDKEFPGNAEMRQIAVSSWKSGIQYFVNINDLYDNRIERMQEKEKDYVSKIKTTEATYEIPTPIMNGYPQALITVLKRNATTTTSKGASSGGCYVATAVYGSYDCPQVWTLRRFRDYTLAETWYGRAFIRTYYTISPALVKWFGHTAWFKKMWKSKLDRMVASLNASGVADSPYEDKVW